MWSEDAEGDGVAAAAPAQEPMSGETEKEEAEEEGADLVVPFKIDLDGELCAAMVQALVKYLMYLRGQIPCVYEEFHALVRRQQQEEETARAAGTRKRKLVGGTVRKARKLVESTEQALGPSLHTMFQRRVRTVAIMFGATVSSPREVWRVDFHGPEQQQQQHGDAPGVRGKAGATLPRERVVRLCVQKIIRTVLSYATQHFSSSLAVTSIHLLVLAEKNDAPVDGFVPKQQFRLRLPKVKKGKQTHLVEITHGKRAVDTDMESEDAGVGAAREGNADDDDDGFMWYQCIRPFHGVVRIA